MAKTRSFSIYLLKQGETALTALINGNNLEKIDTTLKDTASFYVMDEAPKSPWWRDFLGIAKKLEQTLKGGILFFTVKERNFAITFGHVAHNLKENSYECDFGLKTTLNAINPKIKSSDIVNIVAGKRLRIQYPIAEDLTFFDLGENENIIKSLVGYVKGEFKSIFSNITGKSSVRVSSKCSISELERLCTTLLSLYQNKDNYKKVFPNISNIEPIQESELIETLQEKLLDDLKNNNEKIYLIPPNIVDYEKISLFAYQGSGRSKIYSEIDLLDYLKYLQENKKTIDTYDLLEKTNLCLLDDNEQICEKYPINKCIIYDTNINDKSYYLNEGNWYLVDSKFVTKISDYINSCFLESNTLPDYTFSNEAEFNKNAGGVCLDCKDISLNGTTKIEPCDIYKVEEGYAVFYHIKVSTKSASLSHLFNQGYNSLLLLKQEDEAMNKLKELLNNDEHEIMPINNNKIKVIYGIITRKPADNKLNDLPFFSKITLYRMLKNFRVLNVPAHCTYIKNLTTKQVSSKKKKEKPNDSHK